MTGPNPPRRSLVAFFNDALEEHRRTALGVVAVISFITLIAAQIYSPIQDFLTNRNVVSFLTLLLVLDLATMNRETVVEKGQELAENQDIALPRLIGLVSRCRNVSIDLLEYAGATTLPLIREVQRERVPVRILVKHPETIAGLQQQRMLTTLDTLYNSIFENSPGLFEIRCYREPYSLRGRRIGVEILEIGWLTPDARRNTAYGHANPSFLVDPKMPENLALLNFFARTFSDLWDSATTEDGAMVLARMNGGT